LLIAASFGVERTTPTWMWRRLERITRLLDRALLAGAKD
jgi:hypothetical protein